MLYLIGGAARVGKTQLARRLLIERGVPCFCCDYFVSALEQGAPELGIESEAPNERRAPLVWPRLAPMLRNIVEVEPAYTVDGDVLWPAGVRALLDDYPGQVRACFLGYAESTPEHKLAEIRAYPGAVNDWIQKHDDAYILALAEEMIAWSRFLRDECGRLGLRYVDVSERFEAGLGRAWQRLVEGAVIGR